MKATVTATPPTVKVGFNKQRLIEVCWSGRVTGGEVAQALVEAKRLLGDDRVAWIVVDTSEVTGYELSVRGPSVEFLSFFKQRGLVAIVAIMPNSLVSMFAGTMRLVTKVRFEIVKTRADAERYLASNQAPPPAPASP